ERAVLSAEETGVVAAQRGVRIARVEEVVAWEDLSYRERDAVVHPPGTWLDYRDSGGCHRRVSQLPGFTWIGDEIRDRVVDRHVLDDAPHLAMDVIDGEDDVAIGLSLDASLQLVDTLTFEVGIHCRGSSRSEELIRAASSLGKNGTEAWVARQDHSVRSCAIVRVHEVV